jgi:hypothetical protein
MRVADVGRSCFDGVGRQMFTVENMRITLEVSLLLDLLELESHD